MGTLAGFVVICVTPAAAFWGLSRALRWLHEADRMPWQAAPQPVATYRPIEQLTADLRRLSRSIQQLEAGDAPAKWWRLNAVELAYDDVLRTCCSVLRLPPPGPSP